MSSVDLNAAVVFHWHRQGECCNEGCFEIPKSPEQSGEGRANG